MYTMEVQAAILRLLDDSPIVSDEAIRLVRDFVRAGETFLAFDTLCSWLFEEDLPISRSYYERLVDLAPEVYAEESLDRLDELIREG